MPYISKKKILKFSQAFQRTTVLWLVAVFVLQSGCAWKAPKTQYQATMGKVTIVTTSQKPEIKFKGFVQGKGEGAAKGAGQTFLVCLTGMGHCSGDFCALAAIIWLGVCGVASAAGGVAGAVKAPSADKVQAAVTPLYMELDERAIQESLRSRTESVARTKGAILASVSPEKMQTAAHHNDYRPLASEGVDTALEVMLTKVELSGSDFNQPLQLSMKGHVRLIRTSDSSEIFSTDYTYLGEMLKLSEWSANQARRLLDALQTGYETLAFHIYDNVFLLYPFPYRSYTKSFIFGLEPLYPFYLPQDKSSSSVPLVDQLQPTLQWQSFPRPEDIKAAPGEMGRVNNVRYDLIIARVHPLEMICRREGISDSLYTVETPLIPDTNYLWTVRARFRLDGRERVTEWSSKGPLFPEVAAPSSQSYQFKTP